MTHPGHGQNLQLAKISQRKQLLQLDCCFLLEPFLVKAAFSYIASMWFPWDILSLCRILHLWFYILHLDRKAKVRKRTRIQVGTDARSSLRILRQPRKDPSKHGNTLVLDRTDSFCLAASWLAETCCLPVRLLNAPGRRAGKYNRKIAAPFLANRERKCRSTVSPSSAFDMIL